MSTAPWRRTVCVCSYADQWGTSHNVCGGGGAELSMGWVDPWVGLGRAFSVFGGLGWVRSIIAIVLKFGQQTQQTVVLGWVGLGWVSQLMGWVGSGQTKWTHGQLCGGGVSYPTAGGMMAGE